MYTWKSQLTSTTVLSVSHIRVRSVAVCELGSGKTQLSAASLSGMSFTLATGISHLQHFSALGEGQEAGEEEEGGSGGGKEGGERAVEGEVAEEEGGEKRVHLVATTGDGAAAKTSTVSPRTSNSEGRDKPLSLKETPEMRTHLYLP